MKTNYEPPRIEVIEVEIEAAILNASGADGTTDKVSESTLDSVSDGGKLYLF